MRKTLSLAFAASFLVAVSGTSVLACSADEASAKFQKRTEQLSTPGAVSDDKVAEAWGMMNEAGTALANGEYDKACKIYDKVATDFGLQQ